MITATSKSLAANPLETRTDVDAALESLLAPLHRLISPSCARVKIGHTTAHFDDIAAQLEGFARRLWGAAPSGAGTHGDGEGVDWNSYPKGLANGTDPHHPEFWGNPAKDHPDQRLVEVSVLFSQ